MSHDMHVTLDKRIRENYGLRHDRLAEIKRRYDPANPFPLNSNTTPAVAS